MTRISILLFSLVFLGSLSLAQNPSQEPGTGSRKDQESQTSGMGMTGMHGMHDMSKMHEQMMNDMQADLDSMRSNLQKMKDQIGKVSDRGTKEQLQLNIDMWQSLIGHMDKHMAAMKKMMSAHKGATSDGTTHEHEHAPATPKQ
jgi:TolA-binding protein